MDKILPFHLSDLTSTSVCFSLRWHESAGLCRVPDGQQQTTRPSVPYITAAPARRWPGHGAASCQHPVPGGRTLACIFLIEWAGLQLPNRQIENMQTNALRSVWRDYPKTRTGRRKKATNKNKQMNKKKKTTQLKPQTKQTKNQPPSTKKEKKKIKQEPALVFSSLERGICYALQRGWCFDPRQALMPVILIQNANICFIHSGLTPWGKRGVKKQGRRSPQDQCFS